MEVTNVKITKTKAEEIWSEYMKNEIEYKKAESNSDYETLYAYHRNIVNIITENYDIVEYNRYYTNNSCESILRETPYRCISNMKQTYDDCMKILLSCEYDIWKLSSRKYCPRFSFIIENDKVTVLYIIEPHGSLGHLFEFQFLLRNCVQEEKKNKTI